MLARICIGACCTLLCLTAGCNRGTEVEGQFSWGGEVIDGGKRLSDSDAGMLISHATPTPTSVISSVEGWGLILDGTLNLDRQQWALHDGSICGVSTNNWDVTTSLGVVLLQGRWEVGYYDSWDKIQLHINVYEGQGLYTDKRGRDIPIPEGYALVTEARKDGSVVYPAHYAELRGMAKTSGAMTESMGALDTSALVAIGEAWAKQVLKDHPEAESLRQIKHPDSLSFIQDTVNATKGEVAEIYLSTLVSNGFLTEETAQKMLESAP